MSASYVSDALHDLSAAVLAMLRGAQVAEAIFAEEPGEYRWTFERLGAGGLRVLIHDMPPTQVSKLPVVVFDGEFRLRSFAGSLLLVLQSLLDQYGEVGCLDRWVNYPFPMGHFQELQQDLSKSSQG